MFWEYFKVLAPSIGLGLIFWLVMRSLFRGDSGERTARMEAEEREAQEWARLKREREAREAAENTSPTTSSITDDADNS